jgi:hypothetical protein
VSIRSQVEFHTGFPDDAVADDHSAIVQWPGLNIAEALKVALELRGYRVSEPINAEENGWELDIWRGRKRLWLGISVVDTDECHLMVENMTFWLWPDMKLHRAFLSDLQGVLQADRRFIHVGWVPKGDSGRNVAASAGPFDEWT